ncbi:hypothetical protein CAUPRSCDRAFT_11525, partial [Caulochytrium protostelioides]
GEVAGDGAQRVLTLAVELARDPRESALPRLLEPLLRRLGRRIGDRRARKDDQQNHKDVPHRNGHQTPDDHRVRQPDSGFGRRVRGAVGHQLGPDLRMEQVAEARDLKGQLSHQDPEVDVDRGGQPPPGAGLSDRARRRETHDDDLRDQQ